MVVKLYGFPASTATRLAALVLREKKVPYVFVPMNRDSKEHKAPAYLEKQPFGQVPYIDDNGFILYESRAIARYIATKYAAQGTEGLIPTEVHANALFEQAASNEFANFHIYAATACFEGWNKKNLGLEPDQAVYEKNVAILEQKLDVYEKILGKQKYLAGNEVTLADLFHLPFGTRLPLAGIKSIENRPNVSRWFNDISSRPAWVAVKDGVTSTA